MTSHPDASAEPGHQLTEAHRLDLADPLYQWRGFLPVGQRQIAPGVTITLLERKTEAPED
jgi:hypothetical protein